MFLGFSCVWEQAKDVNHEFLLIGALTAKSRCFCSLTEKMYLSYIERLL